MRKGGAWYGEGRLPMTTAAPLLNVPQSETDWDQWSFQLAQNIGDILRSLHEQRLANIADPQLFPIPANDIGRWLERTSSVVDEICSTLGISAADIEGVNLEDERERQAWVFTIFQELNAARQILRI